MQTVTSNQLQQIINLINDYSYKKSPKMDLILKSPVTKENIYKRFELLDSLYPLQYSDNEYIEHLCYLFDNIDFEVDLNLIEVSHILNIFKQLAMYINEPRGMYVYGTLLPVYDLDTPNRIKQVFKITKDTVYQDKYFKFILPRILEMNGAEKLIIAIMKLVYFSQ